MNPIDYLYNYKIESYRIYDGDSWKDCVIDFGMNKYEKKVSIRFANIDCPEIRRSAANGVGDKHIKAGRLVLNYIKELMSGFEVKWVRSQRQEGKYSDIVGVVMGDGVNINQNLINRGFAKPYEGDKKVKWTEEELDSIIKELDN